MSILPALVTAAALAATSTVSALNTPTDTESLIAAETDIFVIDGFEGFQMHYERDSSGVIEQIAGHYQQGRVDYSVRQ